jgi:hypothetical protein
MTGSGRPTLYKLEHASRARELCARRHQLRGSAPVGRDAKMTGGKGAKGGNLESLGNSGLFDDGAKRRKLAETPRAGPGPP